MSQIIIPTEHVEAFRRESLATLEWAAADLAENVAGGRAGRDLASDRIGIDRARRMVDDAQDLYDQVTEQDASLVIDVNDAVLEVLPTLLENAADEIRGTGQAMVDADVLDVLQHELAATMFWAEAMEQLRPAFAAKAAATREYYDVIDADKTVGR